MSLIRRVAIPAGETVQVVPPDDTDHSGLWDWTVFNPAATSTNVEFVDAPNKSAGQGVVFGAGSAPVKFTNQGDTIYAFAAAAAELQVLGTPRN